MSDIFFCKFKEKLLEFMEELVDLCPEEPDFIFARMLLKNKNEKEIYESFYKKCYPLRELIWKKDSDFFLKIHLYLIYQLINLTILRNYIQKALQNKIKTVYGLG